MSDAPHLDPQGADAPHTNPHGLSPRFITWAQLCMWAGAFFAGLSGVLGLLYLSNYVAFRDGRVGRLRVIEAEESFQQAAGFFSLAWVVGAVTLIVWSAKVHNATTALLRSVQERKYSWAWAVGVWFIPFANLISAPKMLAEHQRIADAERDGNEVVADWRVTPRRQVLMWWWMLTISGLILVMIGRTLVNSPASTESEFMGGLGLTAGGYLAVSAGLGCGAVFMDKVSARLRIG